MCCLVCGEMIGSLDKSVLKFKLGHTCPLYNSLSICRARKVFPTLTKDQIDNFDTSVYEVAIKACSGVFEKFGNELASGKELTNIVHAAVLSSTKHEDRTPSKEQHTQLVEGTTEYINGSWTNAPESLSIALEMADKLFQLICRKAVDA